MLNKIALTLVGLSCSAAVFSAQAEQPLYLGVQYSQQSVDDASWDFGVVSGVAGYKLNEVFAIEGRLGAGIQDEEYSGTFNTAKVGIDHSYSLLGKASWPVLETLSIYGIAGFNKTKYDFKVNDGDTIRDTYSEDGLIYGAGAEVRLTSNLSINFEYAVLPEIGDDDEDNLDVDSISAGINYRF